jgi:hypothetical protein
MSSFYDSLYQSFSSIINPSSGIGSLDDPSKNLNINLYTTGISEREAISLYLRSGLVQKIIELIPTLSTECHTKVDVLNDKKIKVTDLEIQNHVDNYRVKEIFQRASISARLFKESYILLDVNDGKDLTQPFILDGTTTLNSHYFLEFGAIEPYWNTQHTEILYYKIGYNNDETTKKYSFKQIHPSRILVFAGKTLSPKMRMLNDGYHSSIIEGIVEAYLNLAQSLNMSTSLISRVATFVFKMGGLREVLLNKDEEAIVKRLRQHKVGTGSTGGICIDRENEEVESLGINLSGIPELITKLEDIFTANTDISHDMLWNEGSNSTSSDLENINTQRKIRAFIGEYWANNFNIIVKLICNELLDTTDINFSLVLPEPEVSLADTISAREGQARVDQTYINSGVLDAKSVRESRFNTDSPFDTFISSTSDFSGIDDNQGQNPADKTNGTKTTTGTTKSKQPSTKSNNSKKVKDDFFQGLVPLSSSEDIVFESDRNYQVNESDMEEILADLKLQNPTIWEFATADLDES